MVPEDCCMHAEGPYVNVSCHLVCLSFQLSSAQHVRVWVGLGLACVAHSVCAGTISIG